MALFHYYSRYSNGPRSEFSSPFSLAPPVPPSPPCVHLFFSSPPPSPSSSFFSSSTSYLSNSVTYLCPVIYCILLTEYLELLQNTLPRILLTYVKFLSHTCKTGLLFFFLQVNHSYSSHLYSPCPTNVRTYGAPLLFDCLITLPVLRTYEPTHLWSSAPI